jgi:hypothetical protein
MKEQNRQHQVLWAVIGVCALAGVLVYVGCTYKQVCDCPEPCDGGVDDGGDAGDTGDAGEDWMRNNPNWRVESAPTSTIVGATPDEYQLGANYVTLEPGDSVTVTASECVVSADVQAAIPEAHFLPCTYHWDYGDGDTAEGQSPGAHTYTEEGFYTVTLTAQNAYGAPDLHPPTLHVAVWTGEFSDDFDREEIDHWEHGWGIPIATELELSTMVDWSIDGDRLRSEMSGCEPANTGMLAWPIAQDVHIEVTQERDRIDRGQSQFTDVLLRLTFHGRGVTAPRYTFYRVRIREWAPSETPDHNTDTEPHLDGATECVQIDIFRIALDNPFGEFGQNLRGGNGLVRTDQPVVCGWPREDSGHDFDIVVDLTTNGEGYPHFDVVITDTDDPSRVLEEHLDDNPEHPDHPAADYDPDDPDVAPLFGPGRFGITLCQFMAYFDNFSAESLD